MNPPETSPAPAVVLVVDDTPANLHLASQVLTAKGHRVRVASSAEHALTSIRASSPDLILLDVTLPGMDGYACCRALKGDPATRDIPVIFLTAHQGTEHVVRGFEAGGVDYVPKPFREPELLARVRTHLELRRCRQQLEALSLSDALTGIPNRRHFDTFLEQEWRRACRGGTSLSLVLADVDHFKAFNDHHGHGPGDACLRAVGRAFARALQRPGDLAARYGGEEFAAVLPDTDHLGAVSVAEHLRAEIVGLAHPHGCSPVAPHVTLSLGVATLVPVPDQEPADLLQAADQALYRAKAHGRNRVEG